MEALSQTKYAVQITRQLASLKIVSRLLAHELHAQPSGKQVTLSREEVIEIQTCLEIFIEELSRKAGGGAQAPMASAAEPTLVAARNN
jgi:hypothetical protein